MNKQIYIGSTKDLKKRLVEHSEGKVMSTKCYRPWTLLYYEAYVSEKLARLREKKLKYNGNSSRELKKRIGLIKSGAGFTLIEMLVVLAIIGILTVIGLTELRGAKESARDAARMSDLAQLRLALNLYFDDKEQYPAAVLNPDISTTVASGTIFSSGSNPLYPGYISRALLDPINRSAVGLYYQYDTNENTNHHQYVLCFHKEGGSKQWFYIYSSGIYGEGTCPHLP